ncbi:unnamed protein product [Cuscuta epithymum]|uniref:SBP-type domain-containing protein n=1 Tax=Cuscuta epithymum TaxID=186058 RepID=A0AAV0G6C4_9ASTE|nr:unnamed protein product [Cuscuta epithymum]
METNFLGVRGGLSPAMNARKEELSGDDEEETLDGEEEEEDEKNEEGRTGELHLLKRKKKIDLMSRVGELGKRAGGSSSGGGGGVAPSGCVVETCGADLSFAKAYHKRHKVCEVHAKAPVVFLKGVPQRFCQQCSRFHEVTEFDDSKRSCRRRLAGHNERRRKALSENRGEGPSRKQFGEAVLNGSEIDGDRTPVTYRNSPHNNFHIH